MPSIVDPALPLEPSIILAGAIIAVLLAAALLAVTAATEPRLVQRLKPLYNPCLTLWLAYFVLPSSGQFNLLGTIFIMCLPITVGVALSVRFWKFASQYFELKLCADCGYELQKRPFDTHPDQNPSPNCPECGGRFWLSMPRFGWEIGTTASNMPKLWVSRKQLTAMLALSLAILLTGAVLGRSLPAEVLEWRAGSFRLGWVPPYAIWIAAVALTHAVNRSIRSSADEARLTRAAPDS